MFAVRHRPELVTPALRVWARGFVSYDADGRCSRWLTEGGRPLPLLLAGVAQAVCPSVEFDGVLLQAYRDGQAVTPCHTDLGTPLSFILSIGATRTFRVHHMAAECEKDFNAVSIECVEGTVLVMDRMFQAGWHHMIAPDPGVSEEKLSLVFRTRPGGSG